MRRYVDPDVLCQKNNGFEVMNLLAEAYIRKQIKMKQDRDLRKLIADVREKQTEMAPIIARNNELRKERMRQDGPNGFKMVVKDYN